MLEEERNNKIRLNEARRKAAQKRIDRADNIYDNRLKKTSEQDKVRIRQKNYGKADKEREAKKYAKPVGGIANPINVARRAWDMASAPKNARATDIVIYGIAMILAFFKDLLDIAIIGALPAIGTVITFCISIAIGLVLLFDDVSLAQRQIARRMTKKFLVLIAGTMIESILFGLNFLPFEMITVAIIYWMSLMERKKQS